MQPLTTNHCGSVHYITIRDSRLCTLGCGTRSPLYLIGVAASLRGLCTGKVFYPAQRPVERAPA